MNITISKERLEAGHAREMGKIAKEPVSAQLYDNDDLLLTGSELACLRIANKTKHKETKVNYSKSLSTWYVMIYSGH